MLYDVEGLHNASEATNIPVAKGKPDRRTSAPPRLQLAVKRGFDILASFGLIVFFAPLLAAIALAVVVVDRMPPLYLQQRYGRAGTVFTILKFRTMTVAEAGRDFTQATPGDARITRLGAYLRRTSLDELPQLFNVLVGHMSLVGPRPHALAMEEDIVARYPWATHRLDMRPGMTGLAQIRGLRGPTRRKDDILNRIEADVDYVHGWGLGRDVGILAKTPGVWLGGEKAV